MTVLPEFNPDVTMNGPWVQVGGPDILLILSIRGTRLRDGRMMDCLAFFFQASLTKLSSIFTLKLISAFSALNTLIMVSMVALFALLSSFEICAF